MRSILPIVALVVIFVPTVAFAGSAPRTVLPADTLESAVLGELNEARAAYGLRPLRLDARLTAAAGEHSLEMVETGYFGHESSDGSVFWKRIKRFYRPRPARRMWTVGENLLWQTQRVSAQEAVQRWLRSRPHRENLLQRSFRDVGISAMRAVSAPGIYGQRRVVVLTVDFGAR